MSDLFVPAVGPTGAGSSSAGGGVFGGLGATGGSGGLGGANLDALERQGRRMRMLNTYAPELVTSSPSAALALAQGGLDENDMLRSATRTVDYANVHRLRADLSSESDTVQRATWAGLPAPMRQALRHMGYQAPDETPERPKRKMFGINLPDKVPFTGIDLPDELTLPDSTPVLGPLVGGAQHAVGEGLQGLGGAGGDVLAGFNWIGEQPAHLYRAWKYIQQEGAYGAGGKATLDTYFDNSILADAWSHTDKEDDYVRPQYEERASKLLGGDERALRLARLMSTHKTPQQVVEAFGYQPQSAEAGKLISTLAELAPTSEFREAVHQLSVGQVSFGRVVTQGLGLDDTDAGWGRILSGTLDAGFNLAADPTLAAGRASEGLRFGRWAFTLEDAGDVARGFKVTDAARVALAARDGAAAPAIAGKLGALDMLRGRSVLRWADRVAEGFSTGEYGKLARELPGVSTALDQMVNANLRRAANGEKTLDTAAGVLDWLRDRDGILAMAGSRIGGGSPMVRGLRIPSLTVRDLAGLETKKAWTTALDWGRLRYGPAMGDILGSLTHPAGIARATGQWLVARTVGDPARVLTALTTHAPYGVDHLPLFSDEAVTEFGRLVNSGVFGGMSRSTMDAYIDAFTKGDLVTRMSQVEQFNRELFDRLGIADTPFAQKAVERMRQVYSTAGGDGAVLDPLRTRSGQLVDAQRSSAMAIPTLRDVLRESRTVNMTRWLFHNTPASWADARLTKAWKPMVLMRIGFIPRAAGEELLHFALKHGPTTYLGAKGADWAMTHELGVGLENALAEAKDLGDTEAVNRLQSRLAGTVSLAAPFRSLAAASDRMWMRAWDGLLERAGVTEETSAWRRRLVTKAHNLDEKGVVSGLERYANQLALRQSGVLSWMADAAHIPSKGQVGEFLARHFDPSASLAARAMLDDPTVARAYAEHVAGATMVPQELRGLVDEAGNRVRKVPVLQMRGGRPTLVDVEMRPRPGEYTTLSRGVEQDPTFLDSIYTRQQALTRGDRAGEAVVRVLPRYTGGDVAGLPAKLGYADHAALRTDLNTAWAHERAAVGDEAPIGGKGLLSALRDYIDQPEDFGKARRTWLRKELDAHFRDAGVSLRAKPLLDTIDTAPSPARHWLAYENVHPDTLTDDFERLTRSMGHASRARLARPDLYPHLRESRLYNLGDEPLAVPVANGIAKVYVPLTPDDLGPLGEDFVDAAVGHIKRIGAYSEGSARRIATNAAGLTDTDELRLAAGAMTHHPVAAWGASDPRVAEAISAAAEQVTGVRPTIGILEVPDEAVQRAAGRHPVGLTTTAANWKIADDYAIDAWRLQKTQPTRYTRRLNRLEVDGDWWDEVELARARDAFAHPTGDRLYSPDRRAWSPDPPAAGDKMWFVDVGPGVDEHSPADVIEAFGPKRLPTAALDPAWGPVVTGRQLSTGLPETEALERVGQGAVNEALDILTTHGRKDLPDDVLHEVVEPLLRGDRVYTDAAGHKVLDPGYTFDHLVGGVKVDRLPWESYGPVTHAAFDSTWSRFVSEWFDGPVGHAISAVIRKPLFLHNFGEQLRVSRGVADLFVEPEVHAAAARAATALGLDAEALDTIVLGSRHEDVRSILDGMIGDTRKTFVKVPGVAGDRWYAQDDLDAARRAWMDGPPEGHIRLYRGEVVDERGRGQSFADRYSPTRAATQGMWYTDDPRYAYEMAAQRSADVAGAEASMVDNAMDVQFIDVPEDAARARRVDHLGPEVHALAGGPRTDEWLLTPEMAKGAHVMPAGVIEGHLDQGLLGKGRPSYAGWGVEPVARREAVDDETIGAIRDFAAQRIHGLDVARDNALNRAMQLTTPFIDDHRFRSQMQAYIGNFVPFLFAEEQFAKRWARSVAESPEIIRKGQLMMGGLRAMGVVRKDDQGNQYFVYPGAGTVAKVLSDLAAPIFGKNVRIPYVVQMTGQVGYALPGLGNQMGVPSVGPLVAAPVELLSRHFPEVTPVEHLLVQRGADQPLWRYFVPSSAAKLADAMWGDIDSGQLASATSQAMLTMAVNGQAPPEDATPDEKQQFIDRARAQARFILATRAVMGMNAPAAPQVKFRSDQLNDEFNRYLAAAPIDVAVQAFLAAHPDADAKDILAATTSTSQQEFGGLELPTDAAAGWMDHNAELIAGFPAAASWLMPRPKADDRFSHRAWAQQFAVGLRRHKAPDELLGDVYFQAAARDYFDRRTQHEAVLLTATGTERATEEDAWRAWKDAYFNQHPVFQQMLADPTRIQRRAQAVDELTTLAATKDGVVPAPLAELIRRYQDYRDSVAAMRGDRRSVVENRRKALTEEFSTWALWQVQRHPELSGAYMRLIEPDLGLTDEDAAAPGDVSGGISG